MATSLAARTILLKTGYAFFFTADFESLNSARSSEALFQGSLVFDICQRALISSVTLVPVLVDEAHVPRDPRVCREQAKSCLKLASIAATPLARDRFKELAITLLRLATNLEETNQACLDEWGDPHWGDHTKKAS